MKAVVLFGSAAGGNYHEKHSDLNVLCLVEKAGSAELEALAPVAQWWVRKGHPAPLIFTADELQRSAEVFAIELRDIQHRHRMLLGDDFVSTFQVPMSLHRWQVKAGIARRLAPACGSRYLARRKNGPRSSPS